MEGFVGLGFIYMAIGAVLGCVVVFEIIQDSRKRGLNEASRKALGLEYGGDMGSTPISLFLFPFFFNLMLWPLNFIDPGEPRD